MVPLLSTEVDQSVGSLSDLRTLLQYPKDPSDEDLNRPGLNVHCLLVRTVARKSIPYRADTRGPSPVLRIELFYAAPRLERNIAAAHTVKSIGGNIVIIVGASTTVNPPRLSHVQV